MAKPPKEKSLIDPKSNEAQEIMESVWLIQKVFTTGIFAPQNVMNPLQRAAFTLVMISLNDLLSKAAKTTNIAGADLRVQFDDDVIKETNPLVNDVTDLVREMRNGVCHVPSKNRFEDEHTVAKYSVRYGKGTFGGPGEYLCESQYSDDAAFFYGTRRIYLHRHIDRAYAEVTKKLVPLTGFKT